MALDISGIRNVGEFYSQHYLDALLERDLKDTLDRWSQAEKAGQGAAPYRRLAGLANDYFHAAARAAGERDIERRLAVAADFHARLLDALGHTRSPAAEHLADGAVVPVLASVAVHGQPHLWIVEAPFAASDDDADPLSESPLAAQLPDEAAAAVAAGALTLAAGPWKDLFDGELFRQEQAPRWVLFLAGGDLFLLDRDKWPQGQYLHFDLGQLFGRREPAALRAVAGLLHREVLAPASGASLLDTLDESSHKHAFAVSTDLQRGVQRAIELIANEALHYRRFVSKQAVFNEDDELAARLTRECIVYLYRLLFLFYVEARGAELGVVPMRSDAYRQGYSLESLRDLELVPLTSAAARDGYFLDQSLRRLFTLVQRGFGRGQRHLDTDAAGAGPMHQTFELPGLRSTLFEDPDRSILRGVRLRNAVLQEVLQLLSLSEEGARGRKERGRISYAQLGINQLGAVYEGLLSYTGFFAREDLYEVRAAGDVDNKADARTFYVPASRIHAYDDKEKVRDPFGRPVVHPRGSYLFRLAGRDREKSASYYTPEVLTRCLTKYTLRERLGQPGTTPGAPGQAEGGALAADDILRLTVCEPAMGSGAFLNEAVGQLAHAYLERKQAELGQTIAAEDYQREWQQVKYHFVVNQCHGVDLNPLAAELGKVSLWLNVLQPGVEAPFLDLRIAVGNSLVGARREVFAARDLVAKKDNWLARVPERVPVGQDRPPDTVYHFLVADAGMAPFDQDKVVKGLMPAQVARIKEWRKAVTRPYSEMEVRRLLVLSDRIDELWQAHLEQRRQVLARVRQPVRVWGQPESESGSEVHQGDGPWTARWKSMEECAEIARVLDRGDAPGRRLAAIMDYWCALWFWPVDRAEQVPSVDQWLGDVELLLDGDVDVLAGEHERLAVARDVARAQRFHHWEVAFVDVFADAGGLDVIVGNPPWLKLVWEEGGILGDLEPLWEVHKLSAKQKADRRTELLIAPGPQAAYLREFESCVGAQAFLNARQNYPLLQGIQTNLYKCFLVQAWNVGASTGIVGMLHQPGIFEDANGGYLRASLVSRLRLAAWCKNQLKLFPEVHHERPFAFTVSTAHQSKGISFDLVCNLFHPRTLDECLHHDGLSVVPGIKDLDGNWDVRGHRSRLVRIGDAELALFTKLYDSPGTPLQEARLPVVHSTEILNVLRRFVETSRTLGGLDERYWPSEHFHSTNQQKDGTIQQVTEFPESVSHWIVSGPHFYVATPLNKTPNESCRHNQDFSPLDLTVVPDDYLPRTNYVPACSEAEYIKRTPHWRGQPTTARYRYINRTMIAPTGERTLIPAIIPPGPAHIDLVFSICFEDNRELALFTAMCCSLPIDFLVKTTGKSHARHDVLQLLPLPPANDACAPYLLHRILRLNCLTTPYADLWAELTDDGIATDAFAKPDPRLGAWSQLTPTWQRSTPLRTPYERRQALVELDALAALALGITADELCLIYRVQFPVLQQYERETFYDQRGKIVFTTNRGLTGVGLDRKQWEQIAEVRAGDPLPDWAHDAQGPFVPPFDRCDREADMRQAYEHFQHLASKEP